MVIWPAKEAESRFGDLLNACSSEGPQLVARRGKAVAVLVSIDEWHRLNRINAPSLKSLLLSTEPRGELVLSERGSAQRRNHQMFCEPIETGLNSDSGPRGEVDKGQFNEGR